MTVEVGGSVRSQDDLAAAQRKIRRMPARHTVGDRQCERTAIRVRTDRIREQRLARGKSAFRQVILCNRLHRYRGRSLARDRHFTVGKRRRGGYLCFDAAFAHVVRRRDAHFHRQQIDRVVTVEVGGTIRGQKDLPVIQRKIC